MVKTFLNILICFCIALLSDIAYCVSYVLISPPPNRIFWEDVFVDFALSLFLVSMVGLFAGLFVSSEVEEVVNTESNVQAACREMLERTGDRIAIPLEFSRGPGQKDPGPRSRPGMEWNKPNIGSKKS